MSVECDVGRRAMDLVEVVAQHHKVDAYNAIGWCYAHDQNIIVGLCPICDEEKYTADGIIAAATEWAQHEQDYQANHQGA